MAFQSSKRNFDEFTNQIATMSSTQCSPKRVQTEPNPELWDILTNLPTDQIQSLLYQACDQSSLIADLVRSANNERLAREATTPPINFQRYEQECWYTINKKFSKLAPSKQFEMMGDICETLSDNREAVMELAGPDTRWETRRNALEVG